MPAATSTWSFLPRRRSPAGTATGLYGRLVTQARQPVFYAELAVPDSPEGRLELLMLHVVLMLRRLSREGDNGTQLGRELSSVFITDMDDCLREMGVGDLTVAKKVKQAAAALYDRARDYGAALATADHAAITALVGQHIATVDGQPGREAAARRISAYAAATESLLANSSLDVILGGSIEFPPIAA